VKRLLLSACLLASNACATFIDYAEMKPSTKGERDPSQVEIVEKGKPPCASYDVLGSVFTYSRGGWDDLRAEAARRGGDGLYDMLCVDTTTAAQAQWGSGNYYSRCQARVYSCREGASPPPAKVIAGAPGEATFVVGTFTISDPPRRLLVLDTQRKQIVGRIGTRSYTVVRMPAGPVHFGIAQADDKGAACGTVAGEAVAGRVYVLSANTFARFTGIGAAPLDSVELESAFETDLSFYPEVPAAKSAWDRYLDSCVKAADVRRADALNSSYGQVEEGRRALVIRPDAGVKQLDIPAAP